MRFGVFLNSSIKYRARQRNINVKKIVSIVLLSNTLMISTAHYIFRPQQTIQHARANSEFICQSWWYVI